MDRQKMMLAAALVPVAAKIRAGRRQPRVSRGVFYTRSDNGVELHCTLLGDNPREAVVVAHPAIVGGYSHQVLSLAEEVAKSFSVAVFDFRGHGRSSGACPLGFGAASRDLEAVTRRLESMRFERIGVAGFSLGAGAAFLAATRCVDFRALVAIGCPPSFPSPQQFGLSDTAARVGLRLMGLRTDSAPDDGPGPAEIAGLLPPIPKLLFFGEYETSPREEIGAFIESIPDPKEVHTVAGAWHADLDGREHFVRGWLEEHLG